MTNTVTVLGRKYLGSFTWGKGSLRIPERITLIKKKAWNHSRHHWLTPYFLWNCLIYHVIWVKTTLLVYIFPSFVQQLHGCPGLKETYKGRWAVVTTEPWIIKEFFLIILCPTPRRNTGWCKRVAVRLASFYIVMCDIFHSNVVFNWMFWSLWREDMSNIINLLSSLIQRAPPDVALYKSLDSASSHQFTIQVNLRLFFVETEGEAL